MKFLVLGSGGREHTFAWKLNQSKRCEHVFIAPGNGGTESVGTNVPIEVYEFDKLAEFCLANEVKVIIVGPEVPLVEGIYDYFESNDQLKHIHVIGPSKQGAQLEGSKAFAKEFMHRHEIPTAFYHEFHKENLADGLDFIDNNTGPYVLKADGLAAGKGVVIETDKEKAKSELTAMIAESKFGAASSRVIIEEFLDGIEFSVFVLTDGENFKILPTAKDYKRIGEGDTGLNTGGMGAISPVPFVDEELMNQVRTKIIEPTISGFKMENITYKGFVYIGLILVKGEAKVIEYNCRMGDPETEVVIPRIENDFGDLMLHCAHQTLGETEIIESKEAGATIVLVSGGYPEGYEKGKKIIIPSERESIVFHAGTKKVNGNVLSNGGRVLALTSLGADIQTCVNRSLLLADKIQFEGKYYRKDIGYEF